MIVKYFCSDLKCDCLNSLEGNQNKFDTNIV